MNAGAWRRAVRIPPDGQIPSRSAPTACGTRADAGPSFIFQLGLIRSSAFQEAWLTGRITAWLRLPFGAAVWTTGYVILPEAGIYKPIWEYDAKTLARDLSAPPRLWGGHRSRFLAVRQDLVASMIAGGTRVVVSPGERPGRSARVLSALCRGLMRSGIRWATATTRWAIAA